MNKSYRFFLCILLMLSLCLTGCSTGSGPVEISKSTEKVTQGTEGKGTEKTSETVSGKKETDASGEDTAAGERTEETTEGAEKSTAERTAESSESSETETTADRVTEESDRASKIKRDLTAVHPTVYITSEGPITSKEEYVNCTVKVEDTYEEYLMDWTSAKIRLRGNSTLTDNPAPPYKIKFDEKTGFLGLHEGKSFKTWLLVSHASGICSTYLTLKMGKLIYGDSYYVSDATLAKVYLNGEYLGIYTACEQNQIKKNRINVTEAVTGKEQGDKIGYFFEMDNYANPLDAAVFSVSRKDLVFKDFTGAEVTFATDKYYTVRNDLVSADQVEFLGKYMQNLYKLIYSATYENIAYKFDRSYNLVKASSLTPEEAIRNVIDVDSAVAIYLLNELANNKDKGNGSFFFAIDFSRDSVYEKLTFTPPWDLGTGNFDRTEGYYAGVVNENADVSEPDADWFIMLMYNDWFREEVKEYVKELAASSQMETFFRETSDYLYTFSDDLDSSKKTDLAYRLDFYQKRYQWLIGELGQ